MQAQHCHFCGHLVSLVHVHGHYQCPVCHTNALPCCDRDNCSTNILLEQGMNSVFKKENFSSLSFAKPLLGGDLEGSQ